MAGCCDSGCGGAALASLQKSTLRKVLWINALMFVAIATAAFISSSSALLSDSLDNLGDAFTYALSLYAVSQSMRVKAKVALLKGALILLGALIVIAQVLWKLWHPQVPVFELIGIFSLLGLAANSLCLGLLWRHRSEDINMSSVFECSRNDIASNLAVFLAACGVWWFESGWPDLIVAALLALLLLRSARRVLLGAWQALRAT